MKTIIKILALALLLTVYPAQSSEVGMGPMGPEEKKRALKALQELDESFLNRQNSLGSIFNGSIESNDLLNRSTLVQAIIKAHKLYEETKEEQLRVREIKRQERLARIKAATAEDFRTNPLLRKEAASYTVDEFQILLDNNVVDSDSILMKDNDGFSLATRALYHGTKGIYDLLSRSNMIPKPIRDQIIHDYIRKVPIGPEPSNPMTAEMLLEQLLGLPKGKQDGQL